MIRFIFDDVIVADDDRPADLERVVRDPVVFVIEG